MRDIVEFLEKEISGWISYQKISSKLSNSYFMFDIYAPDNNIHRMSIYEGKLFQHRIFMKVFESFNRSFIFSNRSFLDELVSDHPDIAGLLERNQIIKKIYSPHPYYKERHPPYNWSLCDKYFSLLKNIESQEEVLLYYYEDLKKEER